MIKNVFLFPSTQVDIVHERVNISEFWNRLVEYVSWQYFSEGSYLDLNIDCVFPLCLFVNICCIVVMLA